MNKEAALQRVYDDAFNDELEKIAEGAKYNCPKCGYRGNSPGKCPKCDAMMVPVGKPSGKSEGKEDGEDKEKDND